jgi:hypothetical protein
MFPVVIYFVCISCKQLFSSGAFIGVPVNSLQLARSGSILSVLCVGIKVSTYIRLVARQPYNSHSHRSTIPVVSLLGNHIHFNTSTVIQTSDIGKHGTNRKRNPVNKEATVAQYVHNSLNIHIHRNPLV